MNMKNLGRFLFFYLCGMGVFSSVEASNQGCAANLAWLEARVAQKGREVERKIQDICVFVDPCLRTLMEQIRNGTPVSEFPFSEDSPGLRNFLKEDTDDPYATGLFPLATTLTLYDPLALALDMDRSDAAEYVFSLLEKCCDCCNEQRGAEIESKSGTSHTSYPTVSPFEFYVARFFLYSVLMGNVKVFSFLLSHGAEINHKNYVQCLLNEEAIDHAFLKDPSWNAMDCLVYGRHKHLGPEEGYCYIKSILQKQEQRIKARAITIPIGEGCCSVQ
jgi:hypothetical protein